MIPDPLPHINFYRREADRARAAALILFGAFCLALYVLLLSAMGRDSLETRHEADQNLLQQCLESKARSAAKVLRDTYPTGGAVSISGGGVMTSEGDTSIGACVWVTK